MKAKRKRNIRRFIVIFLAVFVYFCFTSKWLNVSYYTIEASINTPIRIVQLTDLHNAEFGKNNSGLIGLVKKQSPDIIVMTGDMINREDENLDNITSLILELNKIAPVYYGYGNHESDWEANWGCDLHNHLSEAGAIVLNNEFIDVDIKGNALRIAGYMGYYWQPHMLTADEEQQALERTFCEKFQDTARYKLLLNHIPTQWVDWEYINKCHVDLVFSGHYHGGLIQIPIINRGLYAPYVGFFPKYTKGVYEGTEATCVLSAGLGNEHSIPRINNPPEIVVVDLLVAE